MDVQGPFSSSVSLLLNQMRSSSDSLSCCLNDLYVMFYAIVGTDVMMMNMYVLLSSIKKL